MRILKTVAIVYSPSKDENRPKHNKNILEVTGNKSGGQLGHKGKTLEMTSTPDKVAKLYPDYCRTYGSLITQYSIYLRTSVRPKQKYLRKYQFQWFFKMTSRQSLY